MREPLANRRNNETQEIDFNGVRIIMTIGYKADGQIGEIFLNCLPANSTLDAILSDAAIGISIGLQYGAPLPAVAHALKRDSQGRASSPIGAAMDRISPPEAVK